MKNNSFACLARVFSLLEISQTFSFFPRREMTCSAIAQMAQALDNKSFYFFLSFHLQTAGTDLIPDHLGRTQFASQTTGNNRKMFVETRSFILGRRRLGLIGSLSTHDVDGSENAI